MKKRKKEKKQKKQKEKPKEEEQEEKKKGRRVQEVFSRIKWDQQYDKNQCVVGYEDRFVGIMEGPFELWANRDLTEETFIPWHRVQYFKIGDKILWDKKKKIDLIFHTFGNPKEQEAKKNCIYGQYTLNDLNGSKKRDNVSINLELFLTR